MPAPKGWSTAKLKAATLKRLDKIRTEIQGEKRLSYDAVICYLLESYRS